MKKQINKKDIVYFVNAENMHNAGLNYDNLPDCHCEELEKKIKAIERQCVGIEKSHKVRSNILKIIDNETLEESE